MTADEWIDWCERRLTDEAKYCIRQGAPAGAVKAALTCLKGFGLQQDKEMRCAECDCESGGADCNWIKPGPTQWQPMETAPKDGTPVLLSMPYDRKTLLLEWDTWSGGWCDSEGPVFCDATHWMPLPHPPQEQE